MPLLTLILLWHTERLLRPRNSFPWRIWFTILLTELILLYTHNLSVPVVGWLNLAVGLAWLYRRAWKWLGIWIVGQAALLVAYLPWLSSQSRSGTALNTPPHLNLDLIWKIWQSYFAPVPAQIGDDTALIIGSALFGIVALLSMAAILLWGRSRPALLVLSQAILLPILATVELLVAHIDFHPRYFIAGLPAALMLIALGIKSLPRIELRHLAIPAAMALGCGVAAASLTGLLNRPKYAHDDFRAIARYYAALPPGSIILVPYGWEPALEEYYADKLDIHAEIMGIKLHSSAQSAIQRINKAFSERNGPVRVELLTWYQLPADMRGMFPCLLESAGQRTGETVTVQGLHTETYLIERPLQLVEINNAGQDYGPLQLLGAQSGGQQSVCVETTWKLARNTADDWRVSGRLMTTDPPGWTVAQTDTDIRRDDQAPTSDWKAGQQGDAFSLLHFPAGSPPEDYTVQVRLYSPSNPNGLTPLVNGVPSGQISPLEVVRPVGTTMQINTAASLLPTPITLDDNIELLGSDAVQGTLNPGQELRITLQWHVFSDCCHEHPWRQGAILLRGDGWELTQPVKAYSAYSLDRHSFVIPPEASGPATLTVESDQGESTVLATYDVQKTDHLFARPPFDVPVQAEFAGAAVLEGFSVEQMTVSPDQTLDLTLVWQVTSTLETSYVVFTHLLDDNGQVIAQHDGIPANNSRPTTGWVSGEYLVDAHTLQFVRTDYRGPAHLEVGFYDPQTNTRISLANGPNFFLLPVEITVQ